MTLAGLSPENQINSLLRELGCATTNFAAIAGRLSDTRVGAALSGLNDFSADDAEFHLRVARQMKQLQDDKQVPIDWRKVTQIKEILGTKKQRPIPFGVVFIGDRLFEKIENQQAITTDDYQQCAAFKSFLVANAAAKVLDALGYSARATTITNEVRPPETFVESLADVGIVQDTPASGDSA